MIITLSQVDRVPVVNYNHLLFHDGWRVTKKYTHANGNIEPTVINIHDIRYTASQSCRAFVRGGWSVSWKKSVDIGSGRTAEGMHYFSVAVDDQTFYAQGSPWPQYIINGVLDLNKGSEITIISTRSLSPDANNNIYILPNEEDIDAGDKANFSIDIYAIE